MRHSRFSCADQPAGVQEQISHFARILEHGLKRPAQAETQRQRRAVEVAARARAEDVAWSERAAFARRKQFWDSDTEHKYLTSARAHAHKRWFFDHEPGPPPPLPREFR
jgi:hypothetical protein